MCNYFIPEILENFIHQSNLVYYLLHYIFRSTQFHRNGQSRTSVASWTPWSSTTVQTNSPQITKQPSQCIQKISQWGIHHWVRGILRVELILQRWVTWWERDHIIHSLLMSRVDFKMLREIRVCGSNPSSSLPWYGHSAVFLRSTCARSLIVSCEPRSSAIQRRLLLLPNLSKK